ncbi:hypothetical protein F5Y14DRAFT_409562 [Nemania sp. NC0429]|nr:hypothetical protein F5Y14DRAFT_409562 [Nemania sp. NC0429]
MIIIPPSTYLPRTTKGKRFATLLVSLQATTCLATIVTRASASPTASPTASQVRQDPDSYWALSHFLSGSM